MLFQVGGENHLPLINNIHIIYMKNQRRRNELKVGEGGGGLTTIGVSVGVSVRVSVGVSVGMSEGILPREILKTKTSEMPFPAIWAHFKKQQHSHD